MREGGQFSWRAFGRGLAIQGQVILALLLRDMRARFGGLQLGYLWAVLDPLFWVVAFYLVFNFFGRHAPSGTDFGGFLAIGILVYQAWRTPLMGALPVVLNGKALLYFARVQPLDIVLSRCLLEFATLVVVFGVIMTGVAFYYGEFDIDSPLNLVVGLLVAGLLGSSTGLLLASLSVHMESIPNIANIVLRPMFWISGVFFSAAELPRDLRELALLNPVLHLIEFVRDAWFKGYDADYVDIRYPIAFAAVLLYFGLALERRARRYVSY